MHGKLKIYPKLDLVFNEHPNGYPSVAIYFCGCSIKCENCHNKFLQNKNNPDCVEITSKNLFEWINFYANSFGIKNVILLGGEPQEQDKESLKYLLTMLKNNGYSTGIYTGRDTVEQEFIELIDWAKIGKYNANLINKKEKLGNKNNFLATLNQSFVFFT